ncbi:MAG: hemerythrin domain-containing protein [Terriglobales bacterium]
MLRDKNLIPLSRQHQHALALCVRLDRAIQAGDIDFDAWQAEIEQIFEQEITIHFSAEEKDLFPAAAKLPELKQVVQELVEEHAVLRDFFARARLRALEQHDLAAFAVALSLHVRKEERQLFEGMQRLMSPKELEALGTSLETDLREVASTCILPSDATRLRPK